MTLRRATLSLLCLLMTTPLGAAPLGTAFTYQGELRQAGAGVDTQCDFYFSLWDAEADGAEVAPPAQASNVAVTGGLFTVQVDFGLDAFAGEARWLQVAADCPASAGAPTTLLPRQPLTPTPNAVFARRAGAVAFADITGLPGDLADGDDVDDADNDPANELQDLAGVLAQGNDAGGQSIVNLPAPSTASGAATRAYVDSHTDADADPTNELQNLFATVQADSGSTTADATDDALSVVGSGSVTTAIAGDTLTVAGSEKVMIALSDSQTVSNPRFIGLGTSSNTADGVAVVVPLPGRLSALTFSIKQFIAAGTPTSPGPGERVDVIAVIVPYDNDPTFPQSYGTPAVTTTSVGTFLDDWEATNGPLAACTGIAEDVAGTFLPAGTLLAARTVLGTGQHAAQCNSMAVPLGSADLLTLWVRPDGFTSFIPTATVVLDF